MADWFRRVFTRWTKKYTRGLLQERLDGVWVQVHPEAAKAIAGGRVVCAANHVNWFDGFIAHWASWHLGLQPLIVMDEPSWKRLAFAEGFGAMPIRRSEPRKAYEDLHAIAERAVREGGAVWIFPQGEHTPTHLRPLKAHKGVGALAKAMDAPVIPVTLSYVFQDHPEPSALVIFGPPLQRDTHVHHALPESWEDGLSTQTRWYTEGLKNPTLAPNPRSTFPERALSWIWRTFS